MPDAPGRVCKEKVPYNRHRPRPSVCVEVHQRLPFSAPCVCAKLFTVLGGLEPQEAEAVPRDHREAEVDEASRCVETVRVRCVALCVQELGQG